MIVCPLSSRYQSRAILTAILRRVVFRAREYIQARYRRLPSGDGNVDAVGASNASISGFGGLWWVLSPCRLRRL